jgi:plastocyanin
MEVAGIRDFTVEGTPFAFAPKSMEVKVGETVRITFVNKEGFHDLVIDEFAGARTKQLKAGESETITFVANKAGTFEYYCSVGDHRVMGMVGTLIVK